MSDGREPIPEWKYTVKRGNSLWGIAQHYLGQGMRWREIWRLNEETVLAEQKKNPRFRDGTFSYGPDWIFPGMVLTLPVQ